MAIFPTLRICLIYSIILFFSDGYAFIESSQAVPKNTNQTISVTSHFKIKIFGQNQGGAEFQPSRLLTGSSTRILKYVEGLKKGPNAEFGQKDYFEIACSELELLDVDIQDSGYNGYEFVGRIKNNSIQYTLYSVEIKIILYDCVNSSGDKNCTIIGERKESIYLTIPPNQERMFKEPIYIYGDLLNHTGDLVWHHEIISTKSSK